MEQLVVPMTENLVEKAFSRVEEISSTLELSDVAVYSLSSAFGAALDEAWLKIQDVVNQSLLNGWEATKDTVSKVTSYLIDEAKRLGDESKKFNDRLIERLQQVIRETFDLVLGSIRNEIKIGDNVYKLDKVDLEQKILFSASIEASITSLCKFVGSGELVVKGAYVLKD